VFVCLFVCSGIATWYSDEPVWVWVWVWVCMCVSVCVCVLRHSYLIFRRASGFFLWWLLKWIFHGWPARAVAFRSFFEINIPWCNLQLLSQAWNNCTKMNVGCLSIRYKGYVGGLCSLCLTIYRWFFYNFWKGLTKGRQMHERHPLANTHSAYQVWNVL